MCAWLGRLLGEGTAAWDIFSPGVVIPHDFLCTCGGSGVGMLMGEGPAAWDFFFPMCRLFHMNLYVCCVGDSK